MIFIAKLKLFLTNVLIALLHLTNQVSCSNFGNTYASVFRAVETSDDYICILKIAVLSRLQGSVFLKRITFYYHK